jgi:hypothetical protein
MDERAKRMRDFRELMRKASLERMMRTGVNDTPAKPELTEPARTGAETTAAIQNQENAPSPGNLAAPEPERTSAPSPEEQQDQAAPVRPVRVKTSEETMVFVIRTDVIRGKRKEGSEDVQKSSELAQEDPGHQGQG